jgi:iron(III) transport system substrate-binding protein
MPALRRLGRAISLLVLLMLILSACSSPAAPTTPRTAQIIRETVEVQVTTEPQVVRETVEVVVDVPVEPGSLVIYSGRSEALVGPIIAQFAAATGINVEVKYGSTAEIAATLLEEGANSPADIFFAQDPGGLGAVANAGLLASLPGDVLDQVPARFRSVDGQWVGISGRARVVVYNTEVVQPDEIPADIFEFTDPKWSGRIGWAPTNGSLQAMVTAMRAAWGEERTREWLEGIQANNPIAFEGNAPIVEAAAAGEIDVGFVNHYYLYRFLKEQGEGFGARNAFLKGSGPGSLIMTAGAGRLASGKNEANALRFLQFMLSPVAQQYFSAQTFEYPLVEGVVTQAGLPPLADLESSALEIDMADLHDLQGTLTLMRDAGVLPQ